MTKTNWKWKLCLMATFFTFGLMLTACSEGGNSGDAPDNSVNTEQQTPGQSSQQEQQEPEQIDISSAEFGSTDLRIFTLVNSITQEEFERNIEAPIKAKYPHYNLEYIISSQENLQNLIITGRTPDIVITSINNLYNQVMRSELEYDLSDLITKYNYDLDRIEPALIESVQNAAPNDEIYGLPKFINGVVMFYNPDLFDHFGLDYPVSGMTWDEVYQVANTMTRVENGQQYRGMSFFYNNMFAENQLSLYYFHPTENKAAVNTDGFQKLMNEYLRFYHIDGNTHSGDAGKELDQFYIDKNIAMNLAPLSGFGRFTNDLSFNWDIVAAPTFADQPDIGFQANTIYYFVSNANQKAEQAFQTVAELLTDDVQRTSSLEGRATSLKSADIRATLGKGHEDFSDKNFAALFYNAFAVTPPGNPEAASMVSAQNFVIRGFRDAISGTVDVNTMLRNVEEQINQGIAEAMASQQK